MAVQERAVSMSPGSLQRPCASCSTDLRQSWAHNPAPPDGGDLAVTFQGAPESRQALVPQLILRPTAVTPPLHPSQSLAPRPPRLHRRAPPLVPPRIQGLPAQRRLPHLDPPLRRPP